MPFWFKARWPAGMRPLGRKWPRDGRQRKLHCVADFNVAKREGDLPKNADPAELTRYVMAVVRGMAVSQQQPIRNSR
jgi:hypothetical protein